MMDPETLFWVVAGVVAGLGGTGGVYAGIQRLRNGGRSQDQQTPQRTIIQTYPEAQDLAAEDTGRYTALTDTQRNLVSPIAMLEAINRVEARISNLADGSNGHGVVRRQEFNRLEKTLELVDGKVDRISEQVAAVRAVCAERGQCKPKG